MGRFNLGLSDAEFWSLTPRLLFLLIDRWREEQKRQDHRFGVLAQLYAESKRDTKKRREPFEWTDFFPAWKERPAEAEQEGQSELDMAAVLRGLAADWKKREKHGG